MNVLLGLNLFNVFLYNQLMQLFLFSKYKISTYSKGQVIHLQNEHCLEMDIVLDGEVSVQKIDDEGNVLRITAFSGDEVIGANLLFSSKNYYPMTIVSERKSVILHINKEIVLELCQANSLFMSRLMTVIANKTLVLTDKIDAISLKTIRQRINDYLAYQYHMQKTYIIRLNMTKKELAERFGIQRSSLSRELQKMRKEKLIEYSSKTIKILDQRIIRRN